MSDGLCNDPTPHAPHHVDCLAGRGFNCPGIDMKFDEVTKAAFPLRGDEDADVVIHRSASGRIIAFHSPMGADDIKCSICESGARVYLEVTS